MGFGIIVYLDADAAGRVDDAELAATFCDVVGTSSYPLGGLEPLRRGPWSRVGAFSSSVPVDLTVSASGAAVGAPGCDDAVVSVVHTSAETAAAIRSLQRGANVAAPDPSVALFGPDPLTGGRAAGSLWWVYAGGVDELAGVDVVAFGARLREVHSARYDASIDVGAWMSLVNCAGRVGRDGAAAARWEGNRVAWVRQLDHAAA